MKWLDKKKYIKNPEKPLANSLARLSLWSCKYSPGTIGKGREGLLAPGSSEGALPDSPPDHYGKTDDNIIIRDHNKKHDSVTLYSTVSQ